MKKDVIIYDIIDSPRDKKLRSMLSEYEEYRIISEYYDLKVNVEKYGYMPKLNELINKIARGILKPKAIVVRNIDVFKRPEIFLLVKRVLELRNIELHSLRGSDRKVVSSDLRQILERIKKRDYIDLAFFLFIIAMGTWFILITLNMLYAAIVVFTIALLYYTHRKKVLIHRKKLKKFLEMLLNIGPEDLEYLQFKISLRNIEVIGKE